MRHLLVIIPLALLLSSCLESPHVRGNAHMELALGSVSTKAHFEDGSDGAAFVWDAGGGMIAVASDGNTLVRWEDGALWSGMNVTLIDPEDGSRVLRASSDGTLGAGMVSVGDPLFYFSPATDATLCTVSPEDRSVRAVFSLPQVFRQSASSRLDEFGPYCFIHGESSVRSTPSESQKNYTSESTVFRAVPATFRFRVTNASQESFPVCCVRISCDRLFPDRLVWDASPARAAIGEGDDRSGYYDTVTTLIREGHGELLAPSQTGVYYSMCLPFDDASSMDGATLAFILESDTKVWTFNMSAESFFRSSSVRTFAPGRIYTFNFTLCDGMNVELEDISVSDWVDNPFFLPTEEISESIEATVTYWIQDRQNLYTYGFASLIQEESGRTLWSECNIGEYLYSATDIVLRWWDVTPSDADDTDYLSIYFSGITDFLWSTPSRADYDALMTSGDLLVTPQVDEESQVKGLLVSRRDNPDIKVFFPCSGRTEESTDYLPDSSTVITRFFHGRYWTRDEASDDEGWLFHFAFSQVETVVGEVSTLSGFSPALAGGALYEFESARKNTEATVKATLGE